MSSNFLVMKTGMLVYLVAGLMENRSQQEENASDRKPWLGTASGGTRVQRQGTEPGAEGPGPDHRKEKRRPPSGDQGPEGPRLRYRAPVHQLPTVGLALTGRAFGWGRSALLGSRPLRARDLDDARSDPALCSAGTLSSTSR